jgi:hypothetical protein
VTLLHVAEKRGSLRSRISSLALAHREGRPRRLDGAHGPRQKANVPSPAAAPTRTESHADIAVLTVIEPELDAARNALGLSRRTKDADTGTIFWTGTVRSELTGYDYRIVLTCIGEAGNPSAAAAAAETQAKYKPRTVMLMGIAAGLRDKVKIGDAVWSDRVVAYESAAWVKKKDEALLHV